MSEQAHAPAPHELTVEDLWALTTYDLPVTKGPTGRPGVLKMRRMGLMTQLMEDVVNAPLLKAANDIMVDVQAWLKENEGSSFESAFNHLSPEKRETVLEHLHRFACKAVLRPRLTLEPEQEPTAFPVRLCEAELLFQIWNHEPPDAVVPRLSEVAAADFRPAQHSGADQPAPDGGDVRPGPVGVAPVAGGTH
jgi:hypothetical protein